MPVVKIIWEYRDLITGLVTREIREKYIHSVAGLLWLIIYPACILSVYLVVFGFVFKMKAGMLGLDLNMNYTAYLISGYIPWLGAAECLTRAPLAVSSNSTLIRQVVFPLEILPLKLVLVAMTPQLALLIIASVYLIILSHGVVFGLLWLTLPLLLLLEFMLLCGLAWIISAVGVFVRDIKEMVKLMVMVGPFIAPIFYSPGQLPPWAEPLIHLNPFTLLINCFRDPLVHGKVTHPLSWIFVAPVCLGCFYTGYAVFKRLKPGFGNLL